MITALRGRGAGTSTSEHRDAARGQPPEGKGQVLWQGRYPDQGHLSQKVMFPS